MQKNIFKNGEGDSWFERNHKAIMNRQFDTDLIVKAIEKISSSRMLGGRLLEIGCGEGRRLAWLS